MAFSTIQNENRKQQEEHKKQEQNKSPVKTATAFETSAVISIRPYQRQRFKFFSSGKNAGALPYQPENPISSNRENFHSFFTLYVPICSDHIAIY